MRVRIVKCLLGFARRQAWYRGPSTGTTQCVMPEMPCARSSIAGTAWYSKINSTAVSGFSPRYHLAHSTQSVIEALAESRSRSARQTCAGTED